MTKFLISFPAATMRVAPEELAAVGGEARNVVRAAKAAGVYVFSGGIDEDVEPVLVHDDGTTTSETSRLDGGFCVLELPSRAEAEQWAARLAAACRAPQELRQFGYDPES